MATSSIFHNIKISDPKQAEAFVTALEASKKDPVDRIHRKRKTVTTDPATIRRLHEMNRKAEENE